MEELKPELQDDEKNDLVAILQEVENPDELDSSITEDETVDDSVSDDEHHELNVLNLPPRKEIHGQINSKIRLKINWPLVRLIVVSVFLIGVLILLYFFSDETLSLFLK